MVNQPNENVRNNGAGKHAAGKREAERSKGGKLALTLVLAFFVVLIALGAGLAGYALQYDKVYPGVSVGGVDYAGYTIQQVRADLEKRYGGEINRQMTVEINELSFALDLSRIGMKNDVEGTVNRVAAYGRTGDAMARLSAILKGWRKGVNLDIALVLDDDKLYSELERAGAEVLRQVSQPAYTFDGKILTLDRGQSGVEVDNKELFALVKGRLMAGEFDTAKMTVETLEPDILDLMKIAEKIASTPQNPRLDLVKDPTGGTVIPAREGIELDVQAAQAVLQNTTERYVELPVIVTQPAMTTEEFIAVLFRDELSKLTTSFNPSLIGRTKNVRQAADYVGELILNPGDEFSYNKIVGERTVARGFAMGTVYTAEGTEDGLGGGICQVSSTIYAAALRADLKISERRNHTYIVSYVELGEDATVVWGSTDFRFVNDTDYPIKLVMSHGKTTLTAQIMGTAVENKTVKLSTTTLSYTPYETVYVNDPALAPGASVVKNNGFSGYSVETYRVVTVNGEEVSRTFESKSIYRKLNKVVLQGPAIEVTPPVEEVPGPETPTVPDPLIPNFPVVTDPPPSEPVITDPPPAEDPADPEPEEEPPVDHSIPPEGV